MLSSVIIGAMRRVGYGAIDAVAALSRHRLVRGGAFGRGREVSQGKSWLCHRLPRFLLAFGFAVPACAPANEIRVASLTALHAALQDRAGGKTILLAPGRYGDLAIAQRYTRPVSIRSTMPGTVAEFSSIRISQAANVEILNVSLARRTALPLTQPLVSIGGSDRVSLRDLSLQGNANSDPTDDPEGIIVRKSSSITISGCSMTELRRGVAVGFSRDVTIAGNVITNMGEDGIDLAQVERVTIDANYIGEYKKTVEGIHPDGIQVMTDGTSTPSTDITITNNIINQGSGRVMQGIFMGNERAIPYQRLKVANNFIYTEQWHGISIGIADQVEISGNTVMSTKGDKPESWIKLNKVTRSSIRSNVTEALVIVESPNPVLADNIVYEKTPRRRKALRQSDGLSQMRISDVLVDSVGFVPTQSMSRFIHKPIG